MKKVIITLALGFLPQLSNALTCEVTSPNPLFNGFSFQYDYTGKILVLSTKGDSATNLKVTQQEFQDVAGAPSKQYYLATGVIPDIGNINFTLVIDGKVGNGMAEPSTASRVGVVNVTAVTSPFVLNQVPVTCYEDYLSHLGKGLFVEGATYLKNVTYFKNAAKDILSQFSYLQEITSVDSLNQQTKIHLTKTDLIKKTVSTSEVILNQDWYFNIKNIQDFCLENPGALEYINVKNKIGELQQVYSCRVVTSNTVANTFEINWFSAGVPKGILKTEKYKGAPSAPVYLRSLTEYSL